MAVCKECLNDFILVFDREKSDICDWCFYLNDGRNIKKEPKFESSCADSFNVNKKIKKGKKRCPHLKKTLPVGIYYEKQTNSYAAGAHRIYVRISIKRFGVEKAYDIAKIFRSRLRKSGTPDLAYFEIQKIYQELGFSPLRKKKNDSLPMNVRYLPKSKVNGVAKKVIKVVYKKQFIKMFILKNEDDLKNALNLIQKILIFIEENPDLEPKKVFEKFHSRKYPKGVHKNGNYISLIVERNRKRVNKRVPIKLFGEKMAIILAKNVIKQSELIEDFNLKKKFICESVDQAIKLKKRENEKANS